MKRKTKAAGLSKGEAYHGQSTIIANMAHVEI